MIEFYVEITDEKEIIFYKKKEKQKTCKVCNKTKKQGRYEGCKRHYVGMGIFRHKLVKITDKEILDILNNKYKYLENQK